MSRAYRDDEYDDDDRPVRRRSGRDVTHSRSAFGTMFGGSMGCLFAVIAVFVVCVVACGGCLFIGSQVKPTEQSPATKQK